jgi:putative ABC transport system ATP-binding protein
MNEPYIILEGVAKTYGSGPASTYALRDATFEVDAGELCVIVGPSGAGKTTLLNILGGLDSATGGTVYVAGRNIASLSERELTLYRRQAVGFVVQF